MTGAEATAAEIEEVGATAAAAATTTTTTVAAAAATMAHAQK